MSKRENSEAVTVLPQKAFEEFCREIERPGKRIDGLARAASGPMCFGDISANKLATTGDVLICVSNDEVEHEFTVGKRYEIVCGGLIDDEGDWRHDPWSAEFILADVKQEEHA